MRIDLSLQTGLQEAKGQVKMSRGRIPLDPKTGFRQQNKNQNGFGSASGTDSVISTILKQSRKSGQLNLSNRNLTEVPACVWKINLDVPEESKNVAFDTEDRWWEQVDLTKLILASNALQTLSEDIRLLPALTVLDIHDNHLTSLPDMIGELTNLQKLHVGHNNLSGLPDGVGRLSCLRSLHVEYNSLTELPTSVECLYHLEDLDISHNKLNHLPRGIGKLSRLLKLNIAHNSIQVLPHEVGCMTALQILDCTHNQIHSLPDELGNCCHLEQLYLRHNRLTHLPVLHSCQALKELHLGNNALMGLTVEHLEHLQAVSVLDLRDNRISKLPEEITLLQGLQRLDLTNNAISTLPYAMGTMSHLKFLVLEGNPMKGIRRDIMMRGTNELKKYLASRIEKPTESTSNSSVVQKRTGTSGIVGGAGDGVDPYAISSSKTLDYSNKKAGEIPDELWPVAEEAAVTVVNFSKNMLSTLPDKLKILAGSLSELNLAVNKLTVVNDFITDFKKLVMLDLRNNQLTDLPGSMSNLHSLRELMISYNRMHQMPVVVYQLSKLEVLLASDNHIQTVDSHALQQLSRLSSLDLQNNDVAHVPPELGLCTQLRSLQLEGNPLRQPRPAILAKGTNAILDYLRGRIPAS